MKKFDLYIQPYALVTCEPDVGRHSSLIYYFFGMEVWLRVSKLEIHVWRIGAREIKNRVT